MTITETTPQIPPIDVQIESLSDLENESSPVQQTGDLEEQAELTQSNLAAAAANNETEDDDCVGNWEGDDDDDMTVILLDHNANDLNSADFIDRDSPEMQERRRNVLLRELQRVQRASFVHFLILCLIPTSLLLVVIATVLGEDEACESEATTCEREARTFINAFTTRCVCDAMTLVEDP